MVGVDTNDAILTGPALAQIGMGAKTDIGAETRANLLVRHTILRGDSSSSWPKG